MADEPARRPTKKLIWLLVLLLLLAVAAVVGIPWATTGRQPLPEAMEALAGDALVQVEQDPWLTFAPTQGTRDTGFIPEGASIPGDTRP